MRRALMLLTLLLLILTISPIAAQDPSVGADGVGDSYYPQLGNTGYDVRHYTIELDVDVENNFIDGTTIIQAQATQDLTTFNLDLYGLSISQILVDDDPANYTRDGIELIITPEQTLTADQLFTITIAYSGNPEPFPDPGVHHRQVGWIEFDAGIFILDEPSGAMTWFPSNNHPTDKATFTFNITVDNPYVVAANGLLQETTDNGDTTTYHFEATDPMATYLAAVNISEFQVITNEGPDGLPIRNYFPLNAPNRIINEFDTTPDMIAFFSDIFGPYPFEAYGAVVLNDRRYSGAIENQTLSTFGQNGVDQEVIAHELVHQWFGDSISVKSWQDMWLNEGFATYGAALWFENQFGAEQLDFTMSSYYNSLSRRNHPPTADPTPEDIFNITVYYRGAWTLHALRLEVGDEVFFDILRTYYDRHQYGNASSADFIAVAEEISGQDLTDFFQAWLFDRELPPQP